MHPRLTTRLRPTIDHVQVHDFVGGHAHVPRGLERGELEITRMIRGEPIRDRAQPFVYLDAHADLVAVRRHGRGPVIHQPIGLDQLE